MDKALVDVLRGVATNIGYYVIRNHVGKHWNSYSGLSGDLYYYLPETGAIVFRVNNQGWVKFSNFTPTKISKTVYHEPRLSGTVVGDLNSSKITNASENLTLERTYEFNQDETTSMSQEAGVEVGIAIRQLIGYGGAVLPISGETEITASINAHYNKTWGTESSTGRTISNTIEVPPRTEATVTTQKSTSDFKQKAEYWCDLDFDIEIGSTYYYKIKGLDALRVSLGEFSPLNDKFGQLFTDDKALSADLIKYVCKPPTIYLTEELEFSNASTGNVKITERKL